jgi:pimeloyl-ACP methyl ester carboxylesterase
MAWIYLDPDAADGVADKLLDVDSELLTRAPRIEALLEEMCLASRAPRDARRAAEVCGILAMNLRTRAALVRDADTQCVPRSVRELLIGGPTNEVQVPLGAHDPAGIHRWWNRLSIQQQEWLKTNAREAISGLDGIPVDVRHELNRQRINIRLNELYAERNSLQAAVGAEARARLNKVNKLIASHEAMLAPDLKVLLYDPEGDGRVAVALGDITTATHIAVLVPGITNQLDNYRGVIGNARALDAEAKRQGSKDHGIIAWLGYDTPEKNLTAAGRERAQRGVNALVPFVGGLRAVNTHHADVTIMGHSYGSLVTGMAAQAGMEADRIVLVGSPGTGARNIQELSMKPDDVYVARVPDDPIRYVFNSGEAKNFLDGTTVGGPVGGAIGFATGKVTGHDPDVHGPDPSLPKFGATPLPYDNKSHGHSEYYKERSLSLKNHARVMLGRSPQTKA